ncbi:QacE family quaternary ammonium compound efflux SMR transporter [Sphingomonas populi]|uniref:Guanidinium exporter n=1 Tax=Sphingomonas populi TaxID=2484750 RepID=A0A4Q6XZ73_9SPHN|nr:SMR family transporter [Sphingomonas populi]RZF65565.1 QacE family quaternary ammonium compound efflux SMR transporter [Sphingomonas populi]
MPWIALTIAGLLEIVWAYFMKQSAGFTRLGPSVVTLVAMIASFSLLGYAMRSLPLGSAYMIWTGIGALGSFVLGIALLGEAATPGRLIGAGLLLAGLLILKVAS